MTALTPSLEKPRMDSTPAFANSSRSVGHHDVRPLFARTGRVMKRLGMKAYTWGGWATSAKGSYGGSRRRPGSYPEPVPDEAPLCPALLTADKNQHFLRCA